MRIPYERPEAELIDFRALEKLATGDSGPEVDLDPASEIIAGPGVEDWNWSAK